MQQATFSITEGALFLAGHFPGNPVIPAVVLLNELLEGVAAIYPDRHVAGFKQVKFHKPILPGEQIRIDLKPVKMDGIDFQAYWGDSVVFSGELIWEAVE